MFGLTRYSTRDRSPLLLILITLLLAPITASVAQDRTLEERMTGSEFEQAGLDKLSKAELEFLNRWLNNDPSPATPQKSPQTASSNTAPAAASTPAATDQRGLRPKGVARSTIEARIDGDFNGWSGKTRFKLDNGMIWQQVGSGELRHNAASPAVRIEPKSLGSWKLYVEGVGRSVKVKRIK